MGESKRRVLKATDELMRRATEEMSDELARALDELGEEGLTATAALLSAPLDRFRTTIAKHEIPARLVLALASVTFNTYMRTRAHKFPNLSVLAPEGY